MPMPNRNQPHIETLFDLFEAFLTSEPVPEESLRAPCSPDERTVGHGSHKHRCDCGATWKHDDDLPAFCTASEFAKAHTCPECGADVRWKHYTAEDLMDTGMPEHVALRTLRSLRLERDADRKGGR